MIPDGLVHSKAALKTCAYLHEREWKCVNRIAWQSCAILTLVRGSGSSSRYCCDGPRQYTLFEKPHFTLILKLRCLAFSTGIFMGFSVFGFFASLTQIFVKIKSEKISKTSYIVQIATSALWTRRRCGLYCLLVEVISAATLILGHSDKVE